MLYQYKSRSAKGAIVSSEIESDTLKAALRKLRKEGLNVLDIKEQSQSLKKGKKRKKARSQEVLIGFQQLTTLLKSGMNLGAAVDSIAASNPHSELGREFQLIGKAIQRGESFSVALEQSNLKLPYYMNVLVQSGELTGYLVDSLKSGLKQWHEEQQFFNELVNALIYPTMLIFTGICAIIIIFASVVPKFANLLSKSDKELPLLAEIVLKAGTFFNENLITVILTVVAFILLVAYAARNDSMREAGYNFLARLSFIKKVFIEAVLYQWSAITATLTENSVGLEKALELSMQCIKIRQMRAEMENIVKGVRTGAMLSEGLQKSSFFSMTDCNLIRVGEQSGKLPDMLRTMADIYSESGRNRTKKLLVLVEPLAIIIIGAFTGLIMAGVILAITSVNDIAV